MVREGRPTTEQAVGRPLKRQVAHQPSAEPPRSTDRCGSGSVVSRDPAKIEQIEAANQQLQTQQQIAAQSAQQLRSPSKSWLTTTLPLRPACKAGATHSIDRKSMTAMSGTQRCLISRWHMESDVVLVKLLANPVELLVVGEGDGVGVPVALQLAGRVLQIGLHHVEVAGHGHERSY